MIIELIRLTMHVKKQTS